jgi:hypothetical protein
VRSLLLAIVLLPLAVTSADAGVKWRAAADQATRAAAERQLAALVTRLKGRLVNARRAGPFGVLTRPTQAEIDHVVDALGQLHEDGAFIARGSLKEALDALRVELDRTALRSARLTHNAEALGDRAARERALGSSMAVLTWAGNRRGIDGREAAFRVDHIRRLTVDLLEESPELATMDRVELRLRLERAASYARAAWGADHAVAAAAGRLEEVIRQAFLAP